MINIRRLRPTRSTFLAVGALLWAVSLGAARDIVWSDIREGMIDLRGLSRTTRLLILSGFVLLAAMVAALLFNDFWRSLFPLMASMNSTPGRGKLIPVVLIPVTLFLIAVGWSFVLTGAVHSHPLMRLGVLAIYTLSSVSWMSTNINFLEILNGEPSVSIREQWLVGLSIFFVLAVPLLFVIRWRAKPWPVVEFSFLLLFITCSLLLAQERELATLQQFGIPIIMSLLERNISTLQGFVYPLLLLIGVDIAGFTYKVADWTTTTVTERLPYWAPRILLGLLLAWRLRDVLIEAQARIQAGTQLAGGQPTELLGYLGALGVPLGVALVWLMVRVQGWLGANWRKGRDDLTPDGVAGAAEKYTLLVIVAYSAVQLLVFVILDLLASMPFGLIDSRVISGFADTATFLATQANLPWHLWINAIAIVGAAWLAYRGRTSLALFLGIFGIMHLWYEATNIGRPLEAVNWRSNDQVDFWWVIIITVVTLIWLLRRTLTTERVCRLFLMLMVTLVLGLTNFIEDPYGAFVLGLSGFAYIAVGIVWDVLTSGSWANYGTAGLPRISRLFLYVGYVLMTVTVMNWALTSHDLSTVGQLSGNVALVGLERFGKPMLYGIFAVMLTLPPHQDAPEEVDTGSVINTTSQANPYVEGPHQAASDANGPS